jgi:hypothetical protein
VHRIERAERRADLDLLDDCLSRRRPPDPIRRQELLNAPAGGSEARL